jgi:prophage regulatory protein
MHTVERLVKEPEISALTGWRRTALKTREKEGTFTPRIRRSSRDNVWPESEVAAINQAIIAGASKEQLQELVRELVAARAQKARTPQQVNAAPRQRRRVARKHK